MFASLPVTKNNLIKSKFKKVSDFLSTKKDKDRLEIVKSIVEEYDFNRLKLSDFVVTNTEAGETFSITMVDYNESRITIDYQNTIVYDHSNMAMTGYRAKTIETSVTISIKNPV